MATSLHPTGKAGERQEQIPTPPSHEEHEIVGYVEPWIAHPGETIDVKVSSTLPTYSWSLVRVIQGLEDPKAPPVQLETVQPTNKDNTTIAGCYREAPAGSYALVNAWRTVSRDELQGFSFECFFEPWLLQADREQTIFSTLDRKQMSGVALFLNRSGALDVSLGDGDDIHEYNTMLCPQQRRWAQVSLKITPEQLVVCLEPCDNLVEVVPKSSSFSTPLSKRRPFTGDAPLTFAASTITSHRSTKASNFFNGRLDSPRISLCYNEKDYVTWAEYDFSLAIPTDNITDKSGGANHGVLINAPTRGVRGYDWDASQPDWTQAVSGYGAIHFHEDDLDDAAWPTDFRVQIPDTAPSGAYAIVIEATNDSRDRIEELITFFISPSPTSSAKKPSTAIVLSTFTYMAYANEHMYDQERSSRMELSGGVHIRKDANWRKMRRRGDLGCSLYDVHRDGSGVVFSSSKRPILNIKPNYINWAFHRPREFSADQLMIGLLENKLGRRGYDVVTDHDLHLRGVAALEGYSTVITGSHPEYPSLEVLNAYAEFAKRGGSMMYLGGNGFYWCSATDPSRPHRMEVRKGDQGCRSIELPPGERVHSLTGVQGGLWRARGRAPQALVGVGCCACGSGNGVPFRFDNTAVRSPTLQWLFDGLSRDENGNLNLLGVEGFGGGASGDEIDRLDFDLGTPSNAILLATSTGHDDSFGLFNEEILFPMVNTTGTKSAKIRSDMVLFETRGGGHIFSVGSINWYCSLGWNAYDNDVARLTWNVLKRFVEDET